MDSRRLTDIGVCIWSTCAPGGFLLRWGTGKRLRDYCVCPKVVRPPFPSLIHFVRFLLEIFLRLRVDKYFLLFACLSRFFVFFIDWFISSRCCSILIIEVLMLVVLHSTCRLPFVFSLLNSIIAEIFNLGGCSTTKTTSNP